MEPKDKIEINGQVYYTTLGIAEVLDTSISNVKYWKTALRMPYQMIGRQLYFDKAKVEGWLQPDGTPPTKIKRQRLGHGCHKETPDGE